MPHVEADLLVRALEGDEMGHQPEGAQSFRHREPNEARTRMAVALGEIGEGCRLLAHLDGDIIDASPLLGQLHPLGCPREQDDIHLRFEIGDPLAQGGRRHVQRACRSLEASDFGHLGEDANIVPVETHGGGGAVQFLDQARHYLSLPRSGRTRQYTCKSGCNRRV